MKVFYALDAAADWLKQRPTAVTIGKFDGVHLAHQAVIRQTVAAAADLRGRSVIITFFPHPLKITLPERPPALLTALRHRLQLIAALKPSCCIVLNFSRKFASISPVGFVRDILTAALNARCVVSGQTFAFGRQKRGDVTLLQSLARRYHFAVRVVPDIVVQGAPVSSSRVREYIDAGKLNAAAAMLGRRFSIVGTVEHGQRRGRTLGFPTANIDPHQEAIPPNGVYAARARLGKTWYAALVNIGTRPTFEPQRRAAVIEVYLLDFHRRIYGREMEIEFVLYLRPELCYATANQLRCQMRRDEVRARRELRTV